MKIGFLAMSGIRAPRWHFLRYNSLPNGGSERPGLFEGKERHRRGFAGTMTTLAVLLKERKDIFVKSDLGRSRTRESGGGTH